MAGSRRQGLERSPQPWNLGEAGDNQKTPDLAAIVQEIVNRPGWQSGNSLYFMRYAGAAWSPTSSISLTDAMPYDKAIRLIEDMATKN